MDLKLKGRRAFVTGANRGIGAAIAEGLAAEGVHLALFARRRDEAERVVAGLRDRYGIVGTAIAVDLSVPAQIPPAVAQGVEALGGVDILVNCAGGATRGHYDQVADEDWEASFAVKPLGLIRMTRETAPHLKKSDQARIINISGTRGREPGVFSAVAGPINFATLSATKVLANELGPHGITVNAVNPGSTDTRRWDELVRITAEERKLSSEDAEKHLLREVPMGKVVRSTDIADLTTFLASARAGMITGTAINVDGGRTRSI